jgi:hypothetical protein
VSVPKGTNVTVMRVDLHDGFHDVALDEYLRRNAPRRRHSFRDVRMCCRNGDINRDVCVPMRPVEVL